MQNNWTQIDLYSVLLLVHSTILINKLLFYLINNFFFRFPILFVRSLFEWGIVSNKWKYQLLYVSIEKDHCLSNLILLQISSLN